ncbi:Orphan sodium- and chloride-dependent neurotransmitter transporter NTT5 [Cricetulus griseus]|nr:Orphan sodium- and chloride-dependent neurotransmitter transporter NTT5 [Cricetulus griseus]ERE70089.1 orphan sodium- and chloride-dependent neurotransmitter transporter NTT5-like protein [Cricetulus griseus]
MSKNEVFIPRPFWSSKLQYTLALVSYLLMPTHLWSFVSRWLHNGDCSFFIVYIVMLFFIGVPLLFLEMAVGQRAQSGSMDLWKTLSPWFGGVGYSIFMVCFVTNTYINLYNSWILFYMSHVFHVTVPWQHCPFQRNSSGLDPECEQGTSYAYFWYHQTLKASGRIEDGGPPAFNLGMFLLLAWCFVCVFTINGIKSFEKALYVLVPLPYFMISCFLFRILPMAGAEYGLKHLRILKVASIYDLTVWSQAGIQVVLDMGIGFGPIIYFSSHMPDFNNCLGDAFIMGLIKMLTLLFTTPLILSILGLWATITTHRCCKKNTETLIMLVAQGILPPEVQPPDLQRNPTSTYNSWLNSLPPPLRSAVLSKVPECNIQEQFLKVKESPRFVFLTFTEVISMVPASAFWTVLYFLLLLSLGLCTVVACMLGIIIPLRDTFSLFRRHPRTLIVGASMVMFLFGLFFIQPSGIYYFGLLTEYWIALPIISIVICENLAVAWAYGAKRFLTDMTALLSRPICLVCGWLWCYVCPVVLLGLAVAVFIQVITKPLTYVAWDSNTSKDVVRHYPVWLLALVVGLCAFVLMPVPAYFAHCLTLGIPFRPTASSKLSCGMGQPPTEKGASKDTPQGYRAKSLST